MELKDFYSFNNSQFAALKEPSIKVSRAYLDCNRFLDACKEYIYIELGMKYLSEIVHLQAHKALVKLDEFGDLLHQRHLIQIYPDTPFLNWEKEFTNIDVVFEFIIKVLDNIQEALEEFRNITENNKLRAMAIKTDELILDNSKDYTIFLEMWQRWENEGGSKTSFDSWCAKYLHLKTEK